MIRDLTYTWTLSCFNGDNYILLLIILKVNFGSIPHEISRIFMRDQNLLFHCLS